MESLDKAYEIMQNKLRTKSICTISVKLFKGKVNTVNIDEDIYLEGKEPQAK